MNLAQLLLDLVNGYKTHAAAIAMIVAGVGSIVAKDYAPGVAEVLQGLALVFGGATAMGIRHSVANKTS